MLIDDIATLNDQTYDFLHFMEQFLQVHIMNRERRIVCIVGSWNIANESKSETLSLAMFKISTNEYFTWKSTFQLWKKDVLWN